MGSCRPGNTSSCICPTLYRQPVTLSILTASFHTEEKIAAAFTRQKPNQNNFLIQLFPHLPKPRNMRYHKGNNKLVRITRTILQPMEKHSSIPLFLISQLGVALAKPVNFHTYSSGHQNLFISLTVFQCSNLLHKHYSISEVFPSPP